jgi:hypothetical protein
MASQLVPLCQGLDAERRQKRQSGELPKRQATDPSGCCDRDLSRSERLSGVCRKTDGLVLAVGTWSVCMVDIAVKWGTVRPEKRTSKVAPVLR